MDLTRKEDHKLDQLRPSARLWVTGRQLLSFHINVFVLTTVALLLLNLYRSPSDLWIQGLVQRWSLLLIAHAVLVGIGWAASRTKRQPATTATEVRANAPLPATPPQPENAPARSRFRPPASASLSEFRPNRVLRLGSWTLSTHAFTRLFTSATASLRHAASRLHDRAGLNTRASSERRTNSPPAWKVGWEENLASPNRPSGAVENGMTHAADFAQRARSGAGAMLTRLPMLGQESPSSAPDGSTGQPWPPPEAAREPHPPPKPPPSNGFNAPAGFAPLRDPSPAFTPAEPPTQPEQQKPSLAAEDTAVGEVTPLPTSNWASGLVTPRPTTETNSDADSELTQETEWTWMEAAAAAWLARRTDAEPAPTSPNQATPTSDEDIVVPDPSSDDAHPS